ncbi:nuclear transport factor 2 family protein [Spongiivirga citrea]|uniref:Nuclear transport factor 2 family protein n=1 Tax=Spongiivirga citrea TaxID=1481457 RepID=A0A6M0CI24_9FLAO|nr:nuclear transport factor 2 family protein [Spongiivirga citrea]NER16603.1 nuclear transport factor 2 family protein [Spongiivirga citrea]
MRIKIVILTLLCACSCSTEKKQKAHTLTDIQEQNVAVAKQLFLHFNNHEWEKMAGMYPENAEILDPSLGLEVVNQTRTETIAKYKALNEVFSNIHDQVVNIYPSGEKHVIVEFISTGTAPDGTSFRLPICTIMTIENGIITKDYTYYDNFDETNI